MVTKESIEVLTDPYYVEPIRILERVIEYLPSPPKEGCTIGTQALFDREESKTRI